MKTTRRMLCSIKTMWWFINSLSLMVVVVVLLEVCSQVLSVNLIEYIVFNCDVQEILLSPVQSPRQTRRVFSRSNSAFIARRCSTSDDSAVPAAVWMSELGCIAGAPDGPDLS